MYGTCDVPGCTNETYMGWAPICEQNGKQICLPHWNRHKDPVDSFNLWDAFGFHRPTKIKKLAAKKDITKAGCAPIVSPHQVANTLRCRQCGKPRERGHTYCALCSQNRRRQANQRRQHRHRERQRLSRVLA